MKFIILMGALTAVPLFSQPLAEPVAKGNTIRWFTLRETPNAVRAALGAPAMMAESGTNGVAWQYRLGGVDHDDFSHQLVFERRTGRLLSIARNYEEEHDVSALFPPKQTTLHYFPDAAAPQMTLRVRTLPDGLVLIALGRSGGTSQLVLLRRESLQSF
jgi:hypothetical protein